MTDTNTDDGDVTTLPPTEEESRTETVDDEIKPNEGPGPDPKDDGPDVSVRLDAIEKELAALKAMMDTLGYTDPTPSDEDGDGDYRTHGSIEDLFD